MCAKAACSRNCGERLRPCSSGMKDLKGGMGVEKGPEVRAYGPAEGLGGADSGRGRDSRESRPSIPGQRQAPLLSGQAPQHLATVAVTPSAVMAVSTCSTASTSSS